MDDNALGPFELTIDKNHLTKGDCLAMADGTTIVVLKSYKTWWRKILHLLGFKTKIMNVKVALLTQNNQN